MSYPQIERLLIATAPNDESVLLCPGDLEDEYLGFELATACKYIIHAPGSSDNVHWWLLTCHACRVLDIVETGKSTTFVTKFLSFVRIGGQK